MTLVPRNTSSEVPSVLSWRIFIMLVGVVVVVTACEPDTPGAFPAVSPKAQSTGREGRANDLVSLKSDKHSPVRSRELSADKVRQIVGNIGSYLVDLEGSLRTGTGDRFQSDASAARAILGNIRYETGILSRVGIDAGTINSRVNIIEGSLSSATQESWNNVVARSKSEILEMQTALTSVGKNKRFCGGIRPAERFR